MLSSVIKKSIFFHVAYSTIAVERDFLLSAKTKFCLEFLIIIRFTSASEKSIEVGPKCSLNPLEPKKQRLLLFY